MPTVPSYGKCKELGCNNPRSKYSYACVEHGGRDKQKTYTTQRAKTAWKHYSTPFWNTRRAQQLSSHPLCASCLLSGIVTTASAVDHVFPWQVIGGSSFYHNLWQSLCQSCHSNKTALERRGVYRYYGSTVVEYKEGDYHRLFNTPT